MLEGRGFASTWYILLTAISCWITGSVHALYFPMPEVGLIVPSHVSPETPLLRVQALMDDGGEPEPGTVTYSLESDSLTLSSSSGELRLLDNASRRDDGSQALAVVSAAGPNGEEAKMTVHVTLLPADGKTIDCDAMAKDLCFWPEVRYQVLENRPATLLGAVGPSYMATLCPQHNISYSLGNGNSHVSLERTSASWVLRSRQKLDRDKSEMAALGSAVKPTVVCTVTRPGTSQVVNMTFMVSLLDEDDNPPTFMAANVTDKYLNNGTMTQGDVIEMASLMFLDYDSNAVNHYDIELLQDDEGLFQHECKQAGVTHHAEDQTTIHCTLTVAKTAPLPQDMYTVVLRVNDTSMEPSSVPSHVDATLRFHKSTKPLDATPSPMSLMFPEKATVLRGAMVYARVVQPDHLQALLGEQAPKFWIVNTSWMSTHGKSAFDITDEGGIVYVSDAAALEMAPDMVRMAIAWDYPTTGMDSVWLSVMIKNGSSSACNGAKAKGGAPVMCAKHSAWKACMNACGLGTGKNTTTLSGLRGQMEFMSKGGCSWRGKKLPSEEMSKDYATCTPDMDTCPDGLCDPLENMVPLLCPQDCAHIMDESSDMYDKPMNVTRGIRSASGVCTCDEKGDCKCFQPVMKTTTTTTTHMTTAKMAAITRPTAASFNQEEDCPEKPNEPSACGGLCQLGLVLGSLLLIALIIAFIVWRYKSSYNGICEESPCNRLSCSTEDSCRPEAMFGWLPSIPPLCSLPKRFQRSDPPPPPPPVAVTPPSRMSSEFDHSTIQSMDGHLLPYNYMEPLATLNPLHK